VAPEVSCVNSHRKALERVALTADLNYGVFLLADVGAFPLFRDPTGRALKISAVACGIGLALTL
jgi:hypothetical protein